MKMNGAWFVKGKKLRNDGSEILRYVTYNSGFYALHCMHNEDLFGFLYYAVIR